MCVSRIHLEFTTAYSNHLKYFPLKMAVIELYRDYHIFVILCDVCKP
jgi:hypothetical protein